MMQVQNLFFFKTLSIDKLADAIVEARSKTIRERAHTIGQNIRSEEGVDHGIRLIESCSSSAAIF